MCARSLARGPDLPDGDAPETAATPGGGGVVEEEHRSDTFRRNPGFLQLPVVLHDVTQREAPELHFLGPLDGPFPCSFAEYQDIQQGIAHQTIATVHPSAYLTGGQEVGDRCLTMLIDHQAPILVVLSRVDQDGLFRDVDVVAAELAVVEERSVRAPSLFCFGPPQPLASA